MKVDEENDYNDDPDLWVSIEATIHISVSVCLTSHIHLP